MTEGMDREIKGKSNRKYRFGIIGCASSKNGDLSIERWQRLVALLEDTLIPNYQDKIILVSGGAAYCDHLAVELALKYDIPLELHLPCPWDEKNRQYVDNGKFHWAQNPGRLANHYHRLFDKAWNQAHKGKQSDRSSLLDLHRLITKDKAVVKVYKGFHQRNLAVGEVDELYAFCRGDIGESGKGGTFHTWRNSKAPKKHSFNFLKR
jgi:hypothetical protein